MILRKIYNILSSVKLAMGLLLIILVCCLAGVTIWRGVEAGRVIFGTLWFNGLLTLLVVNIVCCFFPRMWRRKLTMVSFGMILFHLCFVAILGGIIYNSMFYFRGMIRLTEGEVLRSSDPQSYDFIDKGRYFSFSKLRGETTLVKMHTAYKIGKEDKRAAYEIEVGERGRKKQGVIYITRSLENNGFAYFNDREGYSILVLLSDKRDRQLYGAHVALQSLKQKDGSYLYTTGTREGPNSFPFPQNPLEPVVNLQMAYRPSKIADRGGEVLFQIWPFQRSENEKKEMIAEGKAAIGEKFDAGNYYVTPAEIRYWVAMMVRYEPGKPIVLASLWVGLGGMVLTFIGRLRRSRGQQADR